MAKRAALAFLATASPVILLTFLFGTAAGDVAFAMLAVAFPIALIALGAAGRDGRLGPLGGPLVGLVLYFAVLVAAMLALRGRVADGPWVLGLPLATAIQVYGVFLAPLVWVSLLYALTFERFGLGREDLDELRRRFRQGKSPLSTPFLKGGKPESPLDPPFSKGGK
jgi:hypothetical protein